MNQYDNLNNNQLIDLISLERARPRRNDKVMQSMVLELVRRQVYPAYGLDGKVDAVKMVEFWGARWHQRFGMQACPGCQADLRDHVNGTPFMNSIAIYAFDRTVQYQCPCCKVRWSREENDKLGYSEK